MIWLLLFSLSGIYYVLNCSNKADASIDAMQFNRIRFNLIFFFVLNDDDMIVGTVTCSYNNKGMKTVINCWHHTIVFPKKNDLNLKSLSSISLWSCLTCHKFLEFSFCWLNDRGICRIFWDKEYSVMICHQPKSDLSWIFFFLCWRIKCLLNMHLQALNIFLSGVFWK